MLKFESSSRNSSSMSKKKEDKHFRVLVWSLPSPLVGSLLLLLAQHLNTLLLPPLFPGALPPSPAQLVGSRVPSNITVILSATADLRMSLFQVCSKKQSLQKACRQLSLCSKSVLLFRVSSTITPTAVFLTHTWYFMTHAFLRFSSATARTCPSSPCAIQPTLPLSLGHT